MVRGAEMGIVPAQVCDQTVDENASEVHVLLQIGIALVSLDLAFVLQVTKTAYGLEELFEEVLSLSRGFVLV